MRKNNIPGALELQKISRILFACAGLFFSLKATEAQAYTFVTLGPNVPETIEQQFIASATTQYQATLVPNPLASNTYQLTLFGLNSSYNPPVTNLELLNSIVTIDSYTYVYGWADAENYQQNLDGTFLGSLIGKCDTPSDFTIDQSTPPTFDAATCQLVLEDAENAIYNESASTPTVVPGDF